MLATMSGDLPHLTEIDASHGVGAVTFTENGENLVGGGWDSVRVWQVKDGEQVATLPTKDIVWRVAVSKDGRWITASTTHELFVWDTMTYEKVLADEMWGGVPVNDTDFSPDSTRLVIAGIKATIWDIAARRKLHTLDRHDWFVFAAKYSPQGDRIATKTENAIRVWNSNDGRLLVHVELDNITQHHTALFWSNDRLFVRPEDNRINEIDATTGIIISKWIVPGKYYTCITLPRHGRFLAQVAEDIKEDTVTLWDTSAHTQLYSIRHHHRISSVTFSSDGQLLAITGRNHKISVKTLFRITEPEILIDSTALDLWKNGQLIDVEASFTTAISASQHTHHALASRAIVRARLGRWDAAIEDAEKSIEIQRSVIGYIAYSVALAGKGKVHDGRRACDISCLYFQSTHAITLLVKAVVLFLAREHEDAISRMDDLITVQPFDPTLYVVQAYMYLLYGNLQVEKADYEHARQSYENARAKLGNCTDQPPLIVLLISGWRFENLAFRIEQRLCEALCASGWVADASKRLLRVASREVNMTDAIKTWICDLMHRCFSTLITNGNAKCEATGEINTPMSRETAHVSLLREWARLRLETESWNDVLTTAVDFVLPRFVIYQVICERLETMGHIVDAVTCLRQMCTELGLRLDTEQVNWTRDFRSRCRGKLEDLGDNMTETKEYDAAISQYTTVPSLDPASPQDLLVNRSNAHVRGYGWKDALNDANKVIRLDPSSPWGYERKHEALRVAGYYEDAVDAFEAMLSKMSQSPDPEIRERSRHYIRPEETKKAIRTIIQNVIRDFPSVLIDTTSGRLHDKSEQAIVFESMPAFAELVSSTTTEIDHTRIEQVVREFYSYATFSHTWQGNEPLFDLVTKILVYDLEKYPTHEKLQMFCKIVRAIGIRWAWSDTCCIDKTDHFVLQEALVSMFKWYENSAMTIIFLLGVSRLAGCGALIESLWNSRGWTLQEYHASKVVRFYTEDWTPYLSLDIHNHKDSPEIISEMEAATGISARALVELRPGLDHIREKLRLASTRRTTRVEDAAYSLMGIFSISLPVTYGDGDKALGQLLAQVLTSSGDTSIIAWTGQSGSFNSCLPANIAVFTESPTLHIPSVNAGAEIEAVIRLPSRDLSLATRLYGQLHGLSVPWFAGRRMKLPCLTFKLEQVSVHHNRPTFHARTTALGTVEIRTEEDISRMDSLYLIHPWIDFLLDRRYVGSTVAKEDVEDRSFVPDELPSLPGSFTITSATQNTWTTGFLPPFLAQLFSGWTGLGQNVPPSPPLTILRNEKEIQMLQFIARLRQPFGALLLMQNRQNVEEYRRVATGSLIKAQVKEITPTTLEKMMQGAQMLDVL